MEQRPRWTRRTQDWQTNGHAKCEHRHPLLSTTFRLPIILLVASALRRQIACMQRRVLVNRIQQHPLHLLFFVSAVFVLELILLHDFLPVRPFFARFVLEIRLKCGMRTLGLSLLWCDSAHFSRYLINYLHIGIAVRITGNWGRRLPQPNIRPSGRAIIAYAIVILPP